VKRKSSIVNEQLSKQLLNNKKLKMKMITTIQQAKRPGWFSEPKNVATTIVGLSLFAGLAYLFAVYVLPFW
jgi:hypothetical protein